MEQFPINNEFVKNNQEKFVVLRLLAEQSLLNPVNRLSIKADESLNLEFHGDIPEGQVAGKFFSLYKDEITDEIRQKVTDIDKKTQMDVVHELIQTSIKEIALYKLTSPNSGAETDTVSSTWPPFRFENVNHYAKTFPEGLTINMTEINGIQEVGDAIRLRIEVEDELITKLLHVLSIDNQTIYAVTEVKPANDEQLIAWFNDMSNHANKIAEILILGFRKPIDEIEPKINDLSEGLLEDGYDSDYITQVTKEIYDRIIAMKSQVEIQAHTDITTPNQEDLAYFKKMLTKIK